MGVHPGADRGRGRRLHIRRAQPDRARVPRRLRPAAARRELRGAAATPPPPGARRVRLGGRGHGLPRRRIPVRADLPRGGRRLLRRDRRRTPPGRLVGGRDALARPCARRPLALPLAAPERRPGRALGAGTGRRRLGAGHRGDRRAHPRTPGAVGQGRGRAGRRRPAARRRGAAADRARAARRAGAQHLGHQRPGGRGPGAARLRPGAGAYRADHHQVRQQGGAGRGAPGARHPAHPGRRAPLARARPRPAARAGRTGRGGRAHRRDGDDRFAQGAPARGRSRRLPHRPGGAHQRGAPLRLAHRARAARLRAGRARTARGRRRTGRSRGRGRQRQRPDRHAGAGRRARWHHRGGPAPGRRFPGGRPAAAHPYRIRRTEETP